MFAILLFKVLYFGVLKSLFIFIYFYVSTTVEILFTFFSNIFFAKVKYPVAPPDVPEMQSPNEQFAALLAHDAPLYSVRQQQLEKEELDQLLEGEVFLRPAYAEVVLEPPEVVMADEDFAVVVAVFAEDVSFRIPFRAEGLAFMD